MILPKHIAIIMDGNGRWAKARRHNRVFGHVRGMKTVRSTVEHAAEMGLENLTLFALSNENWSRPDFEVSSLMKILRKFLQSEINFLLKNNIQLNIIGELSRLPEDIQKLIMEVRLTTQKCGGMKLCLAISYGSQQEILSAAIKLAEQINVNPELTQKLNVESFKQLLETKDLPDPDLVIRTSGETRLSNFLLFQSAYSEIYFTDTLWPDFSKTDFTEAIRWFGHRERRFGKTSQQIKDSAGAQL